jgi:predicted nucleic acid-binding protein
VTAFVDSNVLIRLLTGDPPDMARRATALIRDSDELLLPDLILAEIIYVLESFYEVARHEVARLARAVVGFPSIRTLDSALLLRALEVYETAGIDFAEAYLVASAETAGVVDIVSFDRSIDRVPSVNRIEP